MTKMTTTKETRRRVKSIKPPKTLRELSMGEIIKKSLKQGRTPSQVVSAPPQIRQQVEKKIKMQTRRIKKKNIRQARFYTDHVESINEYYENAKAIPIPFDLSTISIPRILKKLFTLHGTPNTIMENFIDSKRKFQKVDKFLPEGFHLQMMGWYSAYLVKMESSVYLSIFLDDEHVYALCID